MKTYALALACAALLLVGSVDRAAAQATDGPAVPVTVTKAVRRDVPILIRGLGTVQAYYSVQLRTKVDGTLQKIPVKEGQLVKQGDVLAVIDTRPYQAILDAVMAKKQQDQALLGNAKADLARYSSLARQDYASRQQVDTQQAQVNQYTAAIAGDEANIEAAQLNLSFCAITAPFDGRVGLRTVDPGNFVRAAEATPILPLSQLSPIALTFTVPQDNLPAIQKAMAAGKPSVVAYSSDNVTELAKGEVLTIDNTIDATTGTIKVKAVFPNTEYTLWPGQFINTRLLVGTSMGAITVPSAAVQHGQDRLYVYVIKDGKTAEARTVEVARDDGTVAIISKGLDADQTVVTDGHSRLRDGTKVAIAAGGTAKVGG